MTQDKVDLVRKLEQLKSKIQNSQDPETMTLLIKAAIKWIQDIRSGRNQLFIRADKLNEERKILFINQLKLEVDKIENKTNPDIETARFQVTALLVQLMIAFTGLGLHEIDEILKK